MTLVLGGLSDEKLERLSALPFRSKTERYAPAKKWQEEQSHYLHANFPGKYVCVDAATLRYTVGDTHKEVTDQHPATPAGTDLLIIRIGRSDPRPRA